MSMPHGAEDATFVEFYPPWSVDWRALTGQGLVGVLHSPSYGRQVLAPWLVLGAGVGLCPLADGPPRKDLV